MKNIVLNIEEYLIDIEKIVNNYIPYPDNVVYVKNIRVPVIINTGLDSVEDYPEDCIIAGEDYIRLYTRNNMISDTPWHPFKCINLVVDLLTLMIHDESEHRELFIRNPYIPNGGKKFIPKLYATDEDIIYSYIKDISDKDFADILTYVSDIYKIVSVHTEPYPNNYFTFDTESINFIIIDHGDIRSIRWDEYANYTKYNTESTDYQELSCDMTQIII
jgi:hypothetical protein